MNLPSGAQRGFSLLEILMILALIALLATLSVINLGNVYDSAGNVSAEEILDLAVKESRYRAMLENETVFLAFNPKSAAFEVQSESGFTLVELPTDHHSEDNPIEVRFKAPLPARGLPIGFRGDLPDTPRFEPLERVAFSPSLVANPFVVELETPGQVLSFRFDPFSNVRLPSDASP